ncbi:hypothetical protein L218DRAFT_924262 [Marasmius fiardii PR-910]|nr:hypothetical protein L218DRAFT_924262 [Marasmius fiardii PR-910]
MDPGTHKTPSPAMSFVQSLSRMLTINSSHYLPLLEVGQVVIFPIVTVMVMCIVYGFSIALFALCIHLLRQGRMRFQTLYISFIAILFVLATSMVAVEVMKMIQESVEEFVFIKTGNFLPLYNFLKHDTLKTTIYALGIILPILANIAADSILIHRCYVVWGSTRRILLPLVLASFAVNVTSSTGAIMFIIGIRDTRISSNIALVKTGGNIQAVGMILSASFNSILTLLTAGRVWRITRTLRSSSTYNLTTMNRIILESGMLYPLAMIIHLSITNAFPQYHTPFDTLPLVVLAAGIAPTLIIVRIRLGIGARGDDLGAWEPPLLTTVQPTERSMCFSQLSTMGPAYRPGACLMESNRVKLPRPVQAAHVV